MAAQAAQAAQSAISNLKNELSSWLTSLGAGQVSAEFFELIKGIGEAKSKQEELQIIEREALLLKSTMGKTENEVKMRELVIRALYCEMLGVSVPFAYIHALNMTQRKKLIDKRVGYMFVALCFHENHELMMLLINSFRRDLDSTNILEVCSALSAMSMLISAETVPAVVEVVKKLIAHQSELVRKKAVMVLQRCIQRNPDVAHEVAESLRRALCDRDPSVMAASLHCFLLLLKVHAADPKNASGEIKLFRELVPSFVSIMKQIIEHRLDRDFEYHKTPAPWIQTHILRILAYLGRESSTASVHMYEILQECMKRADTGFNAGYAVTYEAVRTICSIHPHKPLLDQAAESISQFIASPNNNLKYMGLTLLAQIVQINPAYAVQHQMHVIQCLEDPDESIQRKTLTLLYKMTNPRNVIIVADKLLEYLKKSTDVYLRTELVSKITALAERYSTNNEWFIKTMSRVFLLGGELVQPDVAFNLMRLIAEGVGESQEADDELRLYAVESYLDLAQKPNLPDILVQVIAWVLGEYGYLLGGSQIDDIIDVLADLMERSDHKSSETRLWCAAALAKATAILSGGVLRPDVQQVFLKYQGSDNIELARRCQEYLSLFSTNLTMHPEIVESIMPRDASCEDISVEEYIGHIVDAAVSQALAEGGAHFIPRSERGGRSIGSTTTVAASIASKKTGKGLRFDKYDAPAVSSPNVTPVTQISAVALSQHNDTVISQATSVATPVPSTFATKQSLMQVAGPWSKSGFGQGLKAAPKAPEPQVTPSVTPAATAAPTQAAKAPAPVQQTVKKPAVDEKTQKLANDLFQGLSDDSSASQAPVSSGIRRGAAGKKSAMQASPTSTNTMVASSSSGDLLGGLTLSSNTSSPTASPTSTNQLQPSSPTATNVLPTTAASRPVDLLLDLDFNANSTATSQPTSADVSSPTKSSDAFGFLESEKPSSPLVAPTTALTPSTGDATSILRPSTTASQQHQMIALAKQLSNMQPDNFNFDNLSASDALEEYVKGRQLGCPQQSIVSGDSHLSISYTKVWRDDEIHACIIIGNRFPKDLNKIHLSLAAGATSSSYLVAGVAGDGVFDASNNSVTIPVLPTRQAALIVVRIQYCGRLEFHSALQAQVQVQTSQTQSKSLKVTIPLDVSDFLRPIGAAKLSVQRYGQLWPQHKHESKLRLAPSNVDSMDELDKKLKANNIAIIQIIRNEAVAAGRLLPNRAGASPNSEGDLGELCLFHLKLEAANTLSIQVRSKDKMITDNAARRLNIVLAAAAPSI